jgi:carbonic anhydrase/acetyltransferase-like protein (isoleucine patch superfamily)
MPIYSLEGVSAQLPDAAQYWLAPGAVLIGDVRLQRDVGIWFGAVLRADNEFISVGTGSNVQDNCVVHSDPKYPVTIGDYCTIGHGAIVHGCTIGDHSLVGMGATIINGARIGRNCLIAANALVGEGKVIPDNSFVKGVPGAVAGELDAARIEQIAHAARWYIARWRRYRDGMVSVG